MQGSQFLCVPSALCWWRWKVLGEHGMEVVPPPALLIQQERNPASTRERVCQVSRSGLENWSLQKHLAVPSPPPVPGAVPVPAVLQDPDSPAVGSSCNMVFSTFTSRKQRNQGEMQKKPSSRPENPPVNPSGHCHLPTGPSILQDHGSAHTEHGASEAF